MRRSIENTRPRVGSVDTWKKNFDQSAKHSRLISKFTGTKLKD